MAELIEMPFQDWGAHWRHLLNAIKPSMCDSNAVFCQITLTTCHYYDTGIGYQLIQVVSGTIRIN